LKLNPTRLLLVCLAAAVSLPALAQEPSAADTFKARCAMCHGADGSADTPAGRIFKAAALTDPMVTTKSDDELHTVIKNGKNKMPPFKTQLTDQQIDAVIGYIRKLPQM
jgi:mono/diheme cytochrome c family protein